MPSLRDDHVTHGSGHRRHAVVHPALVVGEAASLLCPGPSGATPKRDGKCGNGREVPQHAHNSPFELPWGARR